MQQLPFIALYLGIIAWLRTRTVTRRGTSRFERWCTELGFGLLIALPFIQ